MLRRIFAFMLACLMLLGALPTQAYAAVLDEASSNGGNEVPTVTEPCSVEGCTLGKDHAGYCSNAPTYCADTACKLYYREAHAACVFCETPGCTKAAEKHDLCVIPSDNQKSADPTDATGTTDPTNATDATNATDPTEACGTEGCTFGKDHEGHCSNAPTYCENGACLLHYAAEHEACEYCTTENCTRKGEPHTECAVPTYCENETCLLHKTAEHENCEYCATENCTLKNEAHTECKVPGDTVTEPTEATDPTQPSEPKLKLKLNLANDLETAAEEEDPDKPTELTEEQSVYVAVFNGTGFPGEPAWYAQGNYKFFNSSFTTSSWGGVATYSSNAADVLNPEILNQLVQGPTTNGVKVWGYYNAAGTKNMIIDSALKDSANEAKIIKAIKGDRVDVTDYKIIWYVIKYQTDTDWHIDGLIVPVDRYNVNYYGNGNTAGGAPNGETGLKTGETHTVSKNVGNLEKKVGLYTYTFTGWNTQPDGKGTHYDPDDVITIDKEDISLYAEWTPPAISVTVSKRWEDNNDSLGHRPESVTLKLLANGADTGKSVTLPQNGSWTHTFTNLAAVDSNQSLITYSVQETTQSDLYTTAYSGNHTDGLIVTNTLKPDMPQISDQLGKVYITGNKNWLDRNNASGSRPSSITVNLYANGTKVDSQVVTGPDWGWAFDISNGFTINGQKVNPAQATLTIGEEAVAGYELGTVVNPQVIFNAPSVSSGWTPTRPCNSLDWHSTETSWSVVAAKTTGNGPVVIWTPRALAQYERDLITESLHSAVNGLKQNYVFYSGQGTGGYGIQVTSSQLKFSDTSDWSQFYVGTFTVGSVHSQASSITNIRQEPVPVTKIWNDANNQDGKRPASVKVHLVDSNGDHVFHEPAVLTAANGWTYSWNVPLYDASGNALTYSVYEEAVEGYTAYITGDAISGFRVINTHVPETTKINATKAWNDDNNRDGVRPAGVLLQLYADGEAVGSPVTVNTAGSWTYQWEGLQKYKSKTSDGETTAEIDYSVQEVGYLKTNGTKMTDAEETALGYTVAYREQASGSDANLNLITITNSRTTEKTSVEVTKVWADNEDQDGIRPESVTITLYANGEATNKTLVLCASSEPAKDWKATFEGLHKYAGGQEILYSVKETPVEGYTSALTGTAAGGYTITNTHTPAKTQVSVTKVWNDEQNQDGIRPASVTVELYADDQPTGKTIQLTAGNSWSGTFDELDVKAAGEVIVYTVRETKADAVTISYNETKKEFSIPAQEGHPNGYTGVVTGNAADGFTITNTHTPDLKTLNVTKVWNDGSNQDGKRPYAVEISLFVNGQRDTVVKPVVLLSDSDGESEGTFIGSFPIYHGGTMVNYSVQETGFYVTEDDYVAGRKTEGVPTGYGDSYRYNRENLSNTYAIVTNTYTPELRNLTVEKNWNDADNQDGLRPASVTVKLQQTTDDLNANQVKWEDTGKTGILSPANEWQYTFVGLPEYKAGEDLKYRVVENQVAGYAAPVYSSSDFRQITVTNTHTPAKTQVTVTKVWEDGQNQDGKRPASVTVELFANGDAVMVNDQPLTATLSENNSWTHTFTDLPLKHVGKEIVYSVKELTVAEYTTTYASAKTADGTTLTVTNTHIPETITVPVVKNWDDQNNNDGKRPASIRVTLQKQKAGETTWQDVRTLEIDAEDLWTGVFEDLPVYEGGQPLSYRVVEEAIPFYNLDNNGQHQSVTAPLTNNQFFITNTHKPMTVTVKANKVWDDENNQDGKRPASITLHLLASGEHMGDTYKVTLTKDSENNWPTTYTWFNLPMYHDGQLIRYTVTEEEVDKYSTTYQFTRSEDNAEVTATITNSYTPLTRNVTVEKLWDDAYNQDGLRPDSIRVKLMQATNEGGPWTDVKDDNGDTRILDVQRTNGWVGTFTGLPVNAAGTPVIYNAVEIGYTKGNVYTEGLLPDYQVTYSVDDKTGNLEIRNTHTPDTGKLTVTKTLWNDADNQDGIRPESVTVSLYKNNSFVKYTGTGANEDGTVTLNAANNWSFTFENLDLHYGIAQDAIYHVVETPVAGYTPQYSTNYVTLTAGQTATIGITNTHIPEETEITVTKVWQDNSDQDGIRPDKITVTLYADNAVADTFELAASNNWKHTFTGLDIYKNGQAIVYTVKETLADGKEIKEENGKFIIAPPNTDSLTWLSGYEGTVTGDAASGFTITNVHTPDRMQILVQKKWNDGGNNDGKRAAMVEVTLYQNGQPTDYKVELTGNETAPVPFGGAGTTFPRFHNGQRISYSIEETRYQMPDTAWENGVPAGYTRTYSYTYSQPSPSQATLVATVTNTYTPETFNLQVEKTWNDWDNQDDKRPASVTVSLWGAFKPAQGSDPVWFDAKRTQVLSEDNLWTATFTGLSRYQNGQELIYEVREAQVDGYTSSGEGYWEKNHQDPDYVPDLYHLTNTHIPAKTSLTITKGWDDANNQDGIRPNSIKFQLYRNGVPQETYTYVDNDGVIHTANAIVTLQKNAEGKWTYTFENLPVFFHGQPITYTVVETAVEGYTTGYSASFVTGVDVNGTLKTGNIHIVNTHAPAKTQVDVKKVWDDEHNQDGIRPEEITVELYAGDVATGTTRTLNAANNWSATFTDLDKNSGGKAIAYTVRETMADTVAIGYDKTKQEFTIPAPAGHATGYTGKVSGSMADGFTITNTHTPELTTITAFKYWNDGNDQDGHRWENNREITVHLVAGDHHMGPNYAKKLNKDVPFNGDGYQVLTWDETYQLPKYAGGEEIVYTVFEEVEDLAIAANAGNTRAADRYIATYQYDDQDPNKIYIINTYVPETTTVAVMKVWHDDNNRDGIRPGNITMTLHEVTAKDDQGKITASAPVVGVAPLKLNPEDNWHAAWQDLPKYKNGGKLIEYTVVENAVDGYNKDTQGQPDVKFDDRIGLFTVTNTYEPEVTQVKVQKIWEDEEDNDGVRPNGIVVQLYADGSAVDGATAVLNETNDWKHTFGKNDGLTLFVKQNIQGTTSEIKYAVKEIGYVDAEGKQVLNSSDPVSGYTPKYEVDGYEVTITNTHATEKTKVNVSKVWEDAEDNDGKRPESVEVTLQLNGTAVTSYVDTEGNTISGTVTLNEENGWKYTWEDLYVYRAGEEIAYTVTEKEVEGYEATITGTAADGFVITNTHEPEVWEIDITKVWKDNNSSRRPTSITVQLYKDGLIYGDSFKLTKADGWAYSVELPMYEDGEKIEWTIKETKVPTNYDVSYDQTTLTITNKIKANKNNPRTGDFSGIGMWAGMMGTSGAGAAMLLLLGKKKKSGKSDRR